MESKERVKFPDSVDLDAGEIPKKEPIVIKTTVKFEEVYNPLEELGKGAYGVVRKCEHKETKQFYAAKFIRKTTKTKNDVYREIEMLNRLRHLRLVQIEDAYETTRYMIIVTEYIKGKELFEIIAQEEDENFTERQVVKYVLQILHGIYHMHKHDIVHLDLKPENILCVGDDSTGFNEIKLIDFGLAREVKDGSTISIMCGTPEFVAPEVIAFEPVSKASDMWSLGVITYILLSGLSPFLGDNDAETYSNVTKGNYSFEDDEDVFCDISEEGKDFITKLLVRRPRERMTALECFRHPWLTTHRKHTIINKTNLKRFLARRKWKKTIAAIKAVGRFTFGSAIFRNRKANENQDAAKLVNENTDGNVKGNENSENKINLNEDNTKSIVKDIEFITENGNTAQSIRDKEINNGENTEISNGITNNEMKEVLENMKTGEVSKSKAMQHKEDALLTKTTETSPTKTLTVTENKEIQYKESSLNTNNISDYKLTSFLEKEYSKKIEVIKGEEIDVSKISDLENSTNYMSHLAEERLMNKINKKKSENDFLYWGERTDALKERALQRKLLRDKKHQAETGAAESSHVNILHGNNEGVRNLKHVGNTLKKKPSVGSEGYTEIIDKDGKSSSIQHVKSTSPRQNNGNYSDNTLEKPHVNNVTPAKSNTESNEKQLSEKNVTENSGGNNARSNNQSSENIELKDNLQRQRRSISSNSTKPDKKNLFDNNIFKINDEKSNKAPLIINNLEKKAISERESTDNEKQIATSKPKEPPVSLDKNKKATVSPEKLRKVKSMENQNKEANKEIRERSSELTRSKENATVEDINASNRASSKIDPKKRVITYDCYDNTNKKENGNVKTSGKKIKDLNNNLKTIKLTADSQSQSQSLVDKQIANTNDEVKIFEAKTSTSPFKEKKRSVADVTEEREKKNEYHSQKKEKKTTKNENSKLPIDFADGNNNSNSTETVNHIHGLTNTNSKNKFNFKRHSEQDIPIGINSRSKTAEEFEQSTVPKYANLKSPFKKLSDSTNAISSKRTEKEIHEISVDLNNNHAKVNFENNITSPKSSLIKINDKFNFGNPELVTSDKLNRMQDKLYPVAKATYTDTKVKELTCSNFIRRSSLQKHIDENGNFVPFIPLRGQAARSSFCKLRIPEGGVKAKLEAFSGK